MNNAKYPELHIKTLKTQSNNSINNKINDNAVLLTML